MAVIAKSGTVSRKAATIRCLASPVLTWAAGLCTGNAIRLAVHHGHAWPAFAVAGAVAWAASFALLYMPYRARRRERQHAGPCAEAR